MNSALKSASSSSPSEGMASRFRQLSEEYAEFARSAGVRCLPYDDPAVPLFAKGSELTQANAIRFLENALSVFHETVEAGGHLRDDRTLIWRMLNRLGLVPEAGAFEKMGKDDVVEIYSLPDHVHLAWNLNMLNYLSTTMEQLLCLPWWELTSRPQEVINEFAEISKALVSNQVKSTVVPKSSWHVIEERGTHELLVLELRVNFVLPLRKDGANAGFMTVNSAKVIGSNRK